MMVMVVILGEMVVRGGTSHQTCCKDLSGFINIVIYERNRNLDKVIGRNKCKHQRSDIHKIITFYKKIIMQDFTQGTRINHIQRGNEEEGIISSGKHKIK